MFNRNVITRKYDHFVNQVERPRIDLNTATPRDLDEMQTLWNLTQDGNVGWFKHIWCKIDNYHRLPDIWYFLCSNVPLNLKTGQNTSFDDELETFLNYHSRKKTSVIYGVPPSIYSHIMSYLTVEERHYGLRSVSYTLRKPWNECSPLMMQGLRNWSLLMANESTATEKIKQLRRIWGDKEILRRIIYDRRILPKYLRTKIIEECDTSEESSSTPKTVKSIKLPQKSKLSQEFRPFNNLSDGLLHHVLKFGDLLSFFHLLQCNCDLQDVMSRVNFFYKLPIFCHLSTCDYSYINWLPAISSYYFFQFSKLMSEEYANETPDERIMPRYTPSYLVGFYGNFAHISGESNHLRFAVLNDNLGYNHLNVTLHSKNCLVVLNNQLHKKQHYPNYISNGPIFICANGGIGLHNFYRMMVGTVKKVIMLLQSDVYREPLVGELDDDRYYRYSCDKHIVIVCGARRDPLIQFEHITAYQWCVRRIRKLSLLFHWIDWRDFDMLTYRIMNSHDFAALEEITLFGYHDLNRLFFIAPDKQYQYRRHFDWFLTWIEQWYQRIQSHPTIFSFKMCIYIKDSKGERGDMFDVCQMSTSSDVKYHLDLWRSLYNGTHTDSVLAPVTNVLSEFSDIVQCLMS